MESWTVPKAQTECVARAVRSTPLYNQSTTKSLLPERPSERCCSHFPACHVQWDPPLRSSSRAVLNAERRAGASAEMSTKHLNLKKEVMKAIACLEDYTTTANADSGACERRLLRVE